MLLAPSLFGLLGEEEVGLVNFLVICSLADVPFRKNLHFSSPPEEAEPGPSNENIKGEVVSRAEARKVKAGLKRRGRERDSIRALNLPNVRSVVKEMSQEPDSAKRNDDHETGDETSVSTSGTRRKDPVVTMQNIALPRRESLVSIRSGH